MKSHPYFWITLMSCIFPSVAMRFISIRGRVCHSHLGLMHKWSSSKIHLTFCLSALLDEELQTTGCTPSLFCGQLILKSDHCCNCYRSTSLLNQPEFVWLHYNRYTSFSFVVFLTKQLRNKWNVLHLPCYFTTHDRAALLTKYYVYQIAVNFHVLVQLAF